MADPRLFDPTDLLSHAELAADAQTAVSPGDGSPNTELDSARMWTSRIDGGLVRGVKPHSAEKSRLVSRAIDTVSTAMAGKWFTREHGLEYVELYSGPGRLLDERSGKEQAGSPLRALEVRKPFSRYVFSDFAPECVGALRARVGERPNVCVLRGDANDPAHLDRVAARLNPRALVLAYLDPARPQDLRWETVEYLAQRFRYIDLVINLLVNSLMRAIVGASSQGHLGAGSAGRFLNHESPHELLRWSHTGKLNNLQTIDAIRAYYDKQLMSLGFLQPARRTVDFPADNPYYDVLYVSRHKAGISLWDRTNPEPAPPDTLF